MKKLIFIIALGCLMLGYQNFGSLTSDDLKVAEALNDLKRLGGTEAKPMLAVPRSGSSLEGVREDWIQRQGALILNGADQRLLDTINDKITGIFVDDERPAVPENSARGPASVEEKPSRSPASVRFTRINAMELKTEGGANVNASWEADGAHIDYQQKLSDNAQIGVGHKSTNSETQFLLKYNW